MVGALASASTGVMNSVIAKLSKLLEDEYAKLKGVQQQIAFLRDELRAMNATLRVLADVEEDLDPPVKRWRDKVRELTFDIDDCIDSFEVRVISHQQERGEGLIKGIIRKLKKLRARHEIANQIEALKAHVVEESKRHKRYDLLKPWSSSSATFTIDPRLPALYEEVDKLVGIKGPREHIIEWLTNKRSDRSREDLKVVSIVGCGGLGKTTLANQVFKEIRHQFDCSAFVSVSRNPDIKKILRDMLKEVNSLDNTQPWSPNDDERQLVNKLRDTLQDKRYLVVIDDVWATEAWETIKLALLSNNCDSRIITTTRNTAVASKCSYHGGYVYHMEPLSFVDSKRLFFKRAFGSENLYYPHLEEVSNGIIKKCGGLPLAVITISSLLADQYAKDEWVRVLAAIGSALAKDPNAGNMRRILSFSYYDLPYHVRTCLLYLSLFPEDHKINKQRLINRWIAEGLIHEEEGSAYKTGEHYFHELINRSLIQPVDVQYGKPVACRVHDIILDFITCKAAEENFTTLLDTTEFKPIPIDEPRRVYFQNNRKENVIMATNLSLKNVRSLTIFGYFVKTPSLLDFKVLRVLDLKDCRKLQNHHLTGIEMLLHLKYLSLGSRYITELPKKLGELRYLETLDIRETMIKSLPSAITTFQRLVRLLINHDTTFPDGIGRMQSLEELQTFDIFTYSSRNSLQEFGQLTKLRKLRVTWNLDNSLEDHRTTIEGSMKHLLSLCDLHYLLIWNDCPGLSLDSWCPVTLSSLREFQIEYGSIANVPKWMNMLACLTELDLTLCSTKQEDIDILGEIPALLVLRLTTSHGTNGRIFISSYNAFRCLKYFFLHINMCGTLLEFEEGSMPKLQHLMIKFNAHRWKCLNGASDLGIRHLSNLTMAEVIIGTDYSHGCYNPEEELMKSSTNFAASLIQSAVETLPNRPVLRFQLQREACIQFEERSVNYEIEVNLGEVRDVGKVDQGETRVGSTKEPLYTIFEVIRRFNFSQSQTAFNMTEKEMIQPFCVLDPILCGGRDGRGRALRARVVKTALSNYPKEINIGLGGPTGRQLSILGLAAAAPAGAEEKRLARHHLVSSSVQADGPTMGMVAAPRSRRRAAAAPTGAEEERRRLELKRSGRREWRIGGTTSRQWRSGGACGKRAHITHTHQRTMEAAIVSVSTGVMKPLLSKLSKQLEEEYTKLKGVRVHKKIMFIRDELSTMRAALQMLADSEELNPRMKDWRDKVRELAYDMEDCIDAFTSRVDHNNDGSTGFKEFFHKFKKLKARHKIANEIEELKTRVMEVSERHKRYDFVNQELTKSSSFAIDPRLHALYVEVDRLVGIEGPTKHIIDKLITNEDEDSYRQLKVVSIVGFGGLGKTTLANQVYHALRSQFLCSAFISVSRKPNLEKVLRKIAQGVTLPTGKIPDGDIHQLVDKLRTYIQDKSHPLIRRYGYDDEEDEGPSQTVLRTFIDLEMLMIEEQRLDLSLNSTDLKRKKKNEQINLCFAVGCCYWESNVLDRNDHAGADLLNLAGGVEDEVEGAKGEHGGGGEGGGIHEGLVHDPNTQSVASPKSQRCLYFIVIDDLWGTEEWKSIRLALFNNKCGSRIITTTRNAAVASFSCCDGGYVYLMEPLNFADSKRLFLKRAFGSEELLYPHLEEVFHGILEKCGGLPLAINTISSLLVDQHAKEEWDRMLTAIGSALAKNPDVENMTKILSLSYLDLPHHLRTCLLYLSVFPEDYVIDKQQLINRWIAEEFIHEEQGRSTYEVGERYFLDLIDRSLIQPVDVKYGQVEACRVHDIILDFIACKAAEENFVTSLDTADFGQVSDRRVRRLSVMNISEDHATISASQIDLSHIRSLTLFARFMQTPLVDLPAIRVLDLEECENMGDNHPILANVETLLHLKYLRIGMLCPITELPRNIGELRHLETLDMRFACQVKELPSTITRLQRLARLYVHHNTRLPDGVIGKIQNLEELEEFGVVSCEKGKSLQEFGQLPKLRTLKVRCSSTTDDLEGRKRAEDLWNYIGTLISSCNLHHLCILHRQDDPDHLPMSLESWCPPSDNCSLRKLHITHYYISKLPSWMGSLANLKELLLYFYRMRPEDVDILEAIPSLVLLRVRTLYSSNGRITFRGNKGFRCLKYFSLDIDLCGTELEFEAGAMPKIEHLKINFPVHSWTASVNGASDFGIQHLSTLTEVEVGLGCFFIPDTRRMYHPTTEDTDDSPMEDDGEANVVKCFESRIKSAVEALPNRPTCKFNLNTAIVPCPSNRWLALTFVDRLLSSLASYPACGIASESQRAMAAMHVDASTGVMNTLLPKLSKLLEEYTNIKGAARNQA
uniref:Disease resistance protein RPM1 n=1 Tax=Oryza rufipogon TaxID=4529 RepID=A0A0E0QF15_ORYRU